VPRSGADRGTGARGSGAFAPLINPILPVIVQG
jgi:hypothetical protein